MNQELEDLRKANEELKKKLDRFEQISFPNHIQAFPADITARYGRQLILPSFGPKCQEKLLKSKILVVGAGGLGSSTLMHLAGSGVGHIGLIDFDVVEISNLHRQVIHSERNVGRPKVESAEIFLQNLNSGVKYTTYDFSLSSENADDLFAHYDIIVDCSDNAATRYLINDVCVKQKKCFISGSALGFEGQITTYLYDSLASPCYRCIFPNPLPASLASSCSENGVLGVVPGIIGSLQAMETIKIAAGLKASYDQRLMIFDGYSGGFQTMRGMKKNIHCRCCGPTADLLFPDIDYSHFLSAENCGNISLLSDSDRITVQELEHKIVNKENSSKSNRLIVDVRERNQFEICSLVNSINIPLATLSKGNGSAIADVTNTTEELICICRRGNDSQEAVEILKKIYPEILIKDVQGGLEAWSAQVDQTFPLY